MNEALEDRKRLVKRTLYVYADDWDYLVKTYRYSGVSRIVRKMLGGHVSDLKRKPAKRQRAIEADAEGFMT